jgi:hypothetical protein
MKKERNGIKNKLDDPSFSKECRKEIKGEILQKGVSYQEEEEEEEEEEEWHSIKQSII